MSEDFDKEAERKKLEEKYERDKEKRQATEQMSELLLQGATMTNAHCSECGDPIFRYEGQEFCPTCEKPVDRGGDESEGDTDSDIQVTTPSNDARVSFGEDGEASEPAKGDEQSANRDGEQQSDRPAASADQDRRRTAANPADQGRQRSEPPQEPPGQSKPLREQPAQSRTSGENPQPPARPQRPAGDEASVAAAREALVGTLTRFSQQAAATDDPNRARERLAAAREAAEALSALRH
jgi:uncharacterized Zn finger protein (UPF0148 family)